MSQIDSVNQFLKFKPTAFATKAFATKFITCESLYVSENFILNTKI